jgi:hypothetical protein
MEPLNREKQMKIDARRFVRPEAARQGRQSSGHKPVLPSWPIKLQCIEMMNGALSASGLARKGPIFERLEPCEGKLSRTVLRGAGAGNRSRLPGATFGRIWKL